MLTCGHYGATFDIFLFIIYAESTHYDQIYYISDGLIDYGFFPGVVREAGIMRFHKGAVKATSTTEKNMVSLFSNKENACCI